MANTQSLTLPLISSVPFISDIFSAECLICSNIPDIRDYILGDEINTEQSLTRPSQPGLNVANHKTGR